MLMPTKDWILTRIVESEKEEDSNLIKLVSNHQPTKVVEILCFGPDANRGGQLEVGDKVLVTSKTGLKHKFCDIEYEFAKEHNFLGVVEDGKEEMQG